MAYEASLNDLMAVLSRIIRKLDDIETRLKAVEQNVRRVKIAVRS